ncbi:hypothetical protein MACK_001637 [Theileria orientalis]|uniref:MACPF domain-containing protein n=1 Tax=Theileria orientalis TaxID=68886 RepID=A0A976MER6_THEOR|nr:hypothetical protein MACK_001637 [Theileria orientalis]
MRILNYVILINLFFLNFCYARPHPEVDQRRPKNKDEKISKISHHSDRKHNSATVVGSNSVKNGHSFVQKKVKNPKGPSKGSFISKLKPKTKNSKVNEKPKDGKKKAPRFNINSKNKKNVSNTSSKSKSSVKGKMNINKISKTKKVPIKSHKEDSDDVKDYDEDEEEEVPKNKGFAAKAKKGLIGIAGKVADYGLPIATKFATEAINKRLNGKSDDGLTDDELDLDENILGDDDGDEDIDFGSNDEDDKSVKSPPKKTKTPKTKTLTKKSKKDEDDDMGDIFGSDEKTMSTKDDEDDEDMDLDLGDDEDDVEEKKTVEDDEDEEEHKHKSPKARDNEDEDEEETDHHSVKEDDESGDDFDLGNGEGENEEEDEEESGSQNHDEYTSKFKIPSGLEYLGAGYDLIKGNPLGDNITLLDPGYKSNVIQLHWNKNVENISNSMKYLQPVGGWIRPYSSCHKVETVNEINSSDSILKSLSADASVSFSLAGDALKFAASAKYKKLDSASKSGTSKMFINKSYCFKYVAGISTSLPWDFTLGFQSSLDRLVNKFQGLEHDSSCKPYIYREDPGNNDCYKTGITDWMELFNTFGTHVATKIYLGGKIFTTMEVKKNQEKKLSDQGLDVKAILSAEIKNTNIDSNVQVSIIKSNNSKDNLLDTKKSTFVLGGDIYGKGKTMDFIEWSKSVSKHPMPIKAEFTPISHFMDKSLHEAYNKAYLYYGKVILESDFLRYQNQMQLSPEQFMTELDIEHTSGKGMISLKCKDGKSIQFGFVMSTLKDNTHEVAECPKHRSECSTPNNDEIVYSTIWIGCRSENLINLTQKITRDKEPACDSGYNILLGSYFYDSKSNYLLMKPCKLGENKCDVEGEIDYTWMVCTKKFWQLNTRSKVVKKSDLSAISCAPGEKIAFGMSIEWAKDGDKRTFPSIYPCKREEHTCEHRCEKRCNRIVQLIVCK